MREPTIVAINTAGRQNIFMIVAVRKQNGLSVFADLYQKK